MPKQHWLDELDGLIIEGDILESLAQLEDASVEAIVTDPPYGLEFMGKDWDKFAPNAEHRHSQFSRSGLGLPRFGAWTPTATPDGVEKLRQQRMSYQEWCQLWMTECLRVLKPGGHLVSFGGTRTHHRLWVAAEDAGFEVRDMLLWLYGQGMPKSKSVPAAIDRRLLGTGPRGHAIATAGTTQVSTGKPLPPGENLPPYRPESEEAQHWEGWGTGLKPSVEPILLARKPLSEKTVADNVLRYGTGAMNIDATRNAYLSEADKASATPQGRVTTKKEGIGAEPDAGRNLERGEIARPEQKGRWPANVIIQCTCDDPQPVPETAHERQGEASQEQRYDDEGATDLASKPGVRREGGGYAHQPECPAGLLDEQSGTLKSGMMKAGQKRKRSQGAGGYHGNMPDEATAVGTYGDAGGASRFFYCPKATKKERGKDNTHPTVKPLALMRWLIRLVTPPDGVVLDPFCGSGSTLVAAADEGVGFIGVDVSGEYCAIARKRLEGRTS